MARSDERDETILSGSLSLTDPRITAVGLALGGRLAQVIDDGSGRLTFLLTGVSARLLEQIANDEITVSAKALLGALETIYSFIGQRRRRS